MVILFKMKLNDFDFELPPRLIAQAPARPRNHARLLVYDRKSQQISDDFFYNIDKYLIPATTLVLNNSKVEKNRLRFGPVEIFIIETVNPTTVRALVKPGRKFKIGGKLDIPLHGTDLEVKVMDVDEEGIRSLQLSLPIDDSRLDEHRLTPFPPYIKQDESLSRQYQTVYAEPPGSKAAPTAGLHFTAHQLKQLSKQHPLTKLTLHVGLGTFLPVKTEDISRHVMHSEQYLVSGETAAILNRAKSLTAIGTTSLRVLESIGPKFTEASGSTDIFIRPGYSFRSTDSLVTNFHLPKSTLLILVAAFIGSIDETMRIYEHAITAEYRFYSFGDAMLIL